MELTKIEKIQKRLRTYRNYLGKSQDEMGVITGKGLYYGNIERGGDNPSDMALIQIAEKLASGNVKVVPDTLVTSGDGGSGGLGQLLGAFLTKKIVEPVETKSEASK